MVSTLSNEEEDATKELRQKSEIDKLPFDNKKIISTIHEFDTFNESTEINTVTEWCERTIQMFVPSLDSDYFPLPCNPKELEFLAIQFQHMAALNHDELKAYHNFRNKKYDFMDGTMIIGHLKMCDCEQLCYFNVVPKYEHKIFEQPIRDQPPPVTSWDKS